MNVLICGANGFIGRHLCIALTREGHRVVRAVRSAAAPGEVAIDYANVLRAEEFLPHLEGIDVVINAVGILSEKPGASFDAVHRDAPIALFKACESAGVRKIIQISALGGGTETSFAPYMRSKREADAHLMRSRLDWVILRPSLVIGADGGSSRFFRALASLPVVGLPGRGEQQLQPVHIDDLCLAVVRILAPGGMWRCVLEAVGPAPMSYRAMLQAYRRAMDLPEPLWLPVPMVLMKAAAALAAKLPQRVFSPDTLRMLEQGNVADPVPFSRLLGRMPVGPAAWFRGYMSDMLRAQAVAGWSLPMFRIALALLWIVTGLLSFGIYPVAGSLELLQQLGLHGAGALAALYGAALLDCALGLAALLTPGRIVWRLQFVVILGYTVLVTLFLPGYWLHPFAPVLKNIPILAMLIALDAQEPASRRSSST